MTRRSEHTATAQDMADEYGLSVDTVRRYVQIGYWPGDRIGKGKRKIYRFRPEHQQQIAEIVTGGHITEYDADRVSAALHRLSA